MSNQHITATKRFFFMSSQSQTENQIQSRNKIIALMCFGSTLEFFEFSSFLLFSGYLKSVFFPNVDSDSGMFLTFALFSSAYFARPIGAMVFGSLADRFGRSRVFLVTVILMATSTFCIGAFPNSLINTVYCPWLLACLRIGQGMAFGADIPIATIFLAEHAGKSRGLIAGTFWAMVCLGGMFGAITGYTITNYLSDDEIIAWGWRIPFIFGSGLGIISFTLRKKLTETPAFLKILERKSIQKQPLETAIREYKKKIIIAFFLIAGPAICHTMLFALPTYTNKDSTNNFLFSIYATLLPTILSPIIGFISDKVGRRMIFIYTSVIMLFSGITIIFMEDSIIFGVIIILLGLIISGFNSIELNQVELFPTGIRASGMGTGQSLGVMIFIGFQPYIFHWLASHINLGVWVALGTLMIVTSIITLISSLFLSPTIHKESIS